ncbi:MAG: hypothetical protein M1396_04830 [Chloroflexi bacterium]|nr:hypothetical protein [Chloroflexota bacterium]
MGRQTNIRPTGATLYFLPVETRVPLKFGSETLTSTVVARVRLEVEGQSGQQGVGWGETPLNVQWVWPSTLTYEERLTALQELCRRLAQAWAAFPEWGHPLEVGQLFLTNLLPDIQKAINSERKAAEPLPYLAALVCCSPFDIALHDAYGALHQMPVYETYGPPYLTQDLAHFLTPTDGSGVSFVGQFPRDYLYYPRAQRLVAWHLVGGKDPIDEGELTGIEPDDGYPVLLRDWIRRDGLSCLKVKLTGIDTAWDYARLVKVGRLALASGCIWMSADFNCCAPDVTYVNTILDRLLHEEPRIYAMLLYVEQPFPYELEQHQIDVRSVSARKPLFLDESAHDWRLIRLGRQLGWSGVALKTCKTQTGSILSLCWARAHGMSLMVQDLTNPMLAQIPHCLLAAHTGTIMGVESNSMQFYPEASRPEATVHPGLYRRHHGELDLSTIKGAGFGYGGAERVRSLPAPALAVHSGKG